MSFAGDSVSLADRGDSSVDTLDLRPKEAPFAPRTLFGDAPSCSTIDDAAASLGAASLGGASLGGASLDNGAASLEPSQDAFRTADALGACEASFACPRAETSPRDGGGVRDAVCFDATVDDDGPSFLNGPVIDALASTGANPTRVVPRTPVLDEDLASMSLSSKNDTPFASPPRSFEGDDRTVATTATCDLPLADGARRHALGRLALQIEREGGYDTYNYDRNRRAPARIPHVARNEGVNNGEHDRAIEGRFRGADADLSYGARTAFGTNTANGA